MDLESWQLIVNITTSIGTFGAVCLSYFTIREMKKSREESNRPYIIVGYEADEKKVIHLFIKNIGLSPAKNISVCIDKPIKMKDNRDARNLLFNKPIKYLVPNQKIDTIVFQMWEIPEGNKKNAENHVSIKYYDCIEKRPYEENYDIDIEPELSVLYFKQKTMTDLVKQIDDLNKTIKGLK